MNDKRWDAAVELFLQLSKHSTFFLKNPVNETEQWAVVKTGRYSDGRKHIYIENVNNHNRRLFSLEEFISHVAMPEPEPEKSEAARSRVHELEAEAIQLKNTLGGTESTLKYVKARYAELEQRAAYQSKIIKELRKSQARVKELETGVNKVIDGFEKHVRVLVAIVNRK